MFEFTLMVALVHTKLVGTVQTTVVEHVIRPYFFCTWDQNGTLNQKYTGTVYHYDTFRTTRCVGTNVRRTRSVRRRTTMVRWVRNMMVRRTVVVHFVPSNILRHLRRQHNVPLWYESYCFTFSDA